MDDSGKLILLVERKAALPVVLCLFLLLLLPCEVFVELFPGECVHSEWARMYKSEGLEFPRPIIALQAIYQFNWLLPIGALFGGVFLLRKATVRLSSLAWYMSTLIFLQSFWTLFVIFTFYYVYMETHHIL